LKPHVPELAQQSVSPLLSVIVTMVLLNVAFTCATATVILRRIRRFFFAIRFDSLCWPVFYQGKTLSQVLDAFFASNCFLGPFPGPGIRSCSLSSDRQPMAMPQAPVAFDLTQPSNILLLLPAQWTFDGIITFQQRGEPPQFILDQITGRSLGIDTCLLAEIP
jgi:hypothetical protein